MKCKDCKFCDVIDPVCDDSDAYCHRYPPKIVAFNIRDTDSSGRYPEVDEYDWCGEFKKRAKK